MRRVLPAFALLALGLACSGTIPIPDAPSDDDGSEEDGAGDDEDGDEEPQERDITQALPDCTVDMMGALTGLPGYGGSKKDQAKSPVALRKGPSEKAKKVAELTNRGMFPIHKDEPFCRGVTGDDACVNASVGPEQHGLPVYQVKGNWAMVGMGRGGDLFEEGSCQRRVWVHTTDKLEVHEVVDLLDTDLAYLRGGVPPDLYDDVDSEPLDDQPEAPSDDLAAHVTRHEEVDGRTWVKVKLYDQGPCAEDKQEVAEGWTPLHDDAGRLKFWFLPEC